MITLTDAKTGKPIKFEAPDLFTFGAKKDGTLIICENEKRFLVKESIGAIFDMLSNESARSGSMEVS